MRMRWIRGLTALLALPQLEIGLWTLVAPRSWYDHFPGAGHAWVAAYGSYNEHLTRDAGAGFLSLGVLLLWGALAGTSELLRVALAVWLVFATPHLFYHLTATNSLPRLDNLVSLGGLGLEVVLPLALLIALAHRSEPTGAMTPTSVRRSARG